MHLLYHRVVVDDRHPFRQMVLLYLVLMKMVNDMVIHFADVNQVHHLDVVLVHLIVDVLQILDELNLDENLAYLDEHLADVNLVDVVLELNVVHLDVLVLLVDVALNHQMKMDCFLHVVVVAVKLVEKLKVVLMVLQQLVLLELPE